MKPGTFMLWFDDDKQRTLAEKVARAAAYYAQKYGAAPAVCRVNPAALNGGEVAVDGLALRAEAHVQPHHFWLSHEEAI
jgi:hypothetical protein